jgi:predicted transcriptional regulator
MKKPASRPANRKSSDKLIALTVKLDSKTYVRLSTFRAKERQTAQEILTDALHAYLDRMGG